MAGIAWTSIPLACTPAKDTEILILGGGIAGLSLAYQLQKAGKEFILLEGSNRFGGRLFFQEEFQRDVGGRGIGDEYVEVMKLIEELEVELVDLTASFGEPSAIYLNGKLHGQWDNTKPNPSRVEFSKRKNAPRLASLAEWYQRPDLDKPYSTFLKELGHSEAELALINISSNCNDIYQSSSINTLHSSAFRQFNGTTRLFNIKGGTKTFIQALTKKIEMPMLTNKWVSSIADGGSTIKVTCADGSSYRAEKVVTTLPFSTLREVAIDAPLNKNQQDAIKHLPYTSITQIHLQAQPYWEEDEMPIGMWTDTPLERIMNLNQDSSKGELVCWVNGKGTAFFDQMSDREIANFTLKTLKEIRPSTEGRFEYVGTHHWGKYAFNKGAYAEFGVGHAALFTDMIRPAGNLHFAGEHTAQESRGIEGAVESARRVFQEIVS